MEKKRPKWSINDFYENTCDYIYTYISGDASYCTKEVKKYVSEKYQTIKYMQPTGESGYFVCLVAKRKEQE